MRIFIENRDWNKSFYNENDELIFKGERFVKKWRYHWELYNSEGDLIAIIDYKLGWLYKITFQIKLIKENYEFIINFKPYWTPRYEAHIFNDKYEIIQHLGTRKSIFQNNIQIGYISDEVFSMGSIMRHAIIANDNVNKELIVTLVYALLCPDEIDGADFNINGGYLGPQRKPFDVNWEPNQNL